MPWIFERVTNIEGFRENEGAIISKNRLYFTERKEEESSMNESSGNEEVNMSIRQIYSA
jgi:hypothetical protein